MSKVKTDKTPVDFLTAKQAKAEHARLTAEIAQHDKRYYQEDRPSISDAEYDALRSRYAAIEERFPDLRTLESLSLKVGAAPSGKFRKVRHAVPMLSLDNAFSHEELLAWGTRLERLVPGKIRFVGEPSEVYDLAWAIDKLVDGTVSPKEYEADNFRVKSGATKTSVSYRLPPHVYEAADCADLPALRRVVARAESMWGARLAGVFHLANEGSLQEPWIAGDGRISGFGSEAGDGTRSGFYTGCQIVEPELLAKIPPGRTSCIIRETYQPLLGKGAPVFGFLTSGSFHEAPP